MAPAFEGMTRHFPCHGDDAREKASRIFYSRIAERDLSKRPPRMKPPAARRHHAAVAVGDEWVLVHGGEVFDQPPLTAVVGEIFLLHTPTLRWFQPPALWLDATGNWETLIGPRPRKGHTLVRLTSGEIVLFGGLKGIDVASDETWLLEV